MVKQTCILIVLFLLGCGTSHPETKMVGNRLNIKGNTYSTQITEFEYDGCEYIILGLGNPSITHKGNCKYCQERNKCQLSK